MPLPLTAPVPSHALSRATCTALRAAVGAAREVRVLLALLLPLLLTAPSQAAITTGSADTLKLGANPALCLDGGQTGLRAVTCNSANNQRWTLEPQGAWYRLRVASTNECLNIELNSSDAGARVVRYACTGAANERFLLRALAGGGHALVAASSSLCVAAATSTNGAALTQQSCDGSERQNWRSNDALWPSAPLEWRPNGMCAEVNNGSTSNAANVVVRTCSGVAHQRFRMSPRADGSYALIAGHSGQCLDINGASTASGATVIQWPCSSSNNQRFVPRVRHDGYAWMALHSGLCLALESSNVRSGTRLVQRACDGSTAQVWQRDGLPAASRWGESVPQSLVPVAATLLPNGRVLAWSSYERLDYGGENGYTYTSLIDPVSGRGSETLVSNTGHDMFCPGTANLFDGRLLVMGGSNSSASSLYDWNTNSWSIAPILWAPRGYQGATTLSDGNAFTVGGSWSGGLGGKIGEVWIDGVGGIPLPGVPPDDMLTVDAEGIYRADNHMWLFSDSNGRVFHAGPGRRMHWITTDINTGGSVTRAGFRSDAPDSMNGNATMFAPRQLLVTGGAPNYASGEARSGAYRINFAPATPTVSKLAPMAYKRVFHNSVVLPTGEVVVVGGQSAVTLFTDNRAVLVPEIWNPVTNSFLPLAAQAKPRTYHSMALLLGDGRVMSGGGGLCGAACANNHPDIEILSPPYLLNPDGTEALRPRLISAPASARVGTSITVAADNQIESFQWVRLSAVTHSLNNEQRRIEAVPTTSTVRDSTSRNYTLSLNADTGVMLPGYYMLYAVNNAGRVSESRFVRVQP